MTKKKCMVYETLNNVQNLQIIESANNEIRLSGVFGVCGIRNQNNRVYNKDNYGKMVEALQAQIAGEGCPGELEHPNTMNITLENVSHKIESIEMNEDGTITGTVLLLNTPKGQIAKAIVEGGLPLYISSRGAGSIDEAGNVTLSTIKTYDLVGTPGFSQAKLTLKENQTLECLNESLEDGNLMYAIVEDDLLGGGDDSKSDDNSDDKSKKDTSDDSSSDDSSSDNKDDSSSDENSDSSDENEDNNKKDIKTDPTMKEIKDAIDALTDKVTNLEAELHIAQESLTAAQESIDNIQIPEAINYNAIESWVTEEFAVNFKDEVQGLIDESIDNSIKDLAEGVQQWVCEEFAPEVQNWVCEEFAPEVQNWVCEEFAPEVQNWVCEEFAPTVEGWINEELMPTVDSWINEECLPEHKENIIKEVNENVNEFFESQKSTKLSEIDNLLEAIDNKEDNSALETLKESYAVDNKYKGIYCVENMPAEYRPQWEGINENKKMEIIRASRMYDFTKSGVLESFWSNVDFTEKPINENKVDDVKPETNYHNSIVAQMMRLRKQF